MLPLALCWSPAASATTFTVDPVQISLSASKKSALLTLQNTSQETLRFQLSLFTWDQDPQGQMHLGPSSEVVFFPSLVSLPPGESRVVRVGTSASPAATEKAYRIFVEELPPIEKPGGHGREAGVRILTKMGIPIFLEPTNRVVKGSIAELALQLSW